jgi:hypothetical protein
MARIRSIKPEFWTSEQVMECSPNARLLFIGLWNFCDDSGRHPLTPRQIKALIFPSDDFTVESIRGMFGELSANGLIEIYSIENKEYFQVTGWQHQKIDKPQKPKYPGPVAERSPNGIDGEDKGEDRKGEEVEANASSAGAPSAEILSMPVDARKALFGEALPLLAKYVGKPESSMRALVGKWLKSAKDDAAKVSRIIAETVRDERADPVSWIEKCLKPVDPDEAIYRNVL